MGPQFAYALSAQSRSGNAQGSPGRSLELGLGLGLPDWDPSRCIVVFGRRKCVIRRAEPGLELGLARLNTAGKPKACPVGPHSELLAGDRWLEVGPRLGLPDWGPILPSFVLGRRKCVIRQAEPNLELGLAQPNTPGKPKVCPIGPHSGLLTGQ